MGITIDDVELWAKRNNFTIVADNWWKNAQDIICKYKRIQEIMNELNGNFYGSYLKDRQALEKIYEVVKMEKRKFVSADEAINLLPEGDEIHTFYNYGNNLIGADWDRQGVIDKLNASDKIELTGMNARNMGHGLAAYNNDTKWQSEVLFIETDKDKLDAFDPLEVEDGNDDN